MEEKDIQHKKKNLVTIKGSNEGLAFILNDEEPFTYVAEELKHKVRRELSTLLTGPMVRIKIDCGSRELSDKQRTLLEEIISLKENLILTRINSSAIVEANNPNQIGNLQDGSSTRKADDRTDGQVSTIEGVNSIVHMVDENMAMVYRGTVRSGQVLEYDGNIVVFGDVNAGAKVVATGDVMVIGRILGGSVHAGCKGDKKRIVSASSWGNSQVRIADCIGKAQIGDFKDMTPCVSIAYLDEYRIQFKHKKPVMI